MRVLELFAGTGSVGQAFKARGHDVVSLDMDPKSGADIIADVMAWDYMDPQLGEFDVLWASPPCTQYSRAKTTGKPRNLELADRIVQRTLDIIRFFMVHRNLKYYFVENPQTGLLPKRAVIAPLPWWKDVTYCSYGRPFKKATRIWTNVVWWEPRPLCTKKAPCVGVVEGRHLVTAQRGYKLPTDRSISLDFLHALPEPLCEEMCLACEAGPPLLPLVAQEEAPDAA